MRFIALLMLQTFFAELFLAFLDLVPPVKRHFLFFEKVFNNIKEGSSSKKCAKLEKSLLFILNGRLENVVIFWDGNYSSCILLLDLATSLERESYAQSVKCSDVLRSENCTPLLRLSR